MPAPIRFVWHCISTSSSSSAIQSRVQRRTFVSELFHLDVRRIVSSTTSQRDEDTTAANPLHKTNSSTRRSYRISQNGRSRRKLEAKRREEDSLFFLQTQDRTNNAGEESTKRLPQTQEHPNENTESSTGKKTEKIKDENSIRKILLGTPMENPIRRQYIESQQQWKYPRTVEGWRTCFRRAWATYLWTWEGWLLPEKKRDEHGNVIEEPEKEEEDTSTKETMQEKAVDAANQISKNVQKNISTIQQEAPKLLSTAQKLTGISTKEELKEWVSEQLKLGTECLSMFMKGYREGRDEEVDKMLHEYFKELDEEKQNDNSTKEGPEMNGKESDDESSMSNGSEYKVVEKRPWGRKERRRLKAIGHQLPMVDTINS